MSILAHARRAYRVLPLAVRERLAGVSGPLLVAALARGLPPLIDPPTASRAAAIAGLFSTPHGLGIAAHLCAAELEAAGVPVRRIDLSPALNAPIEGAPLAPAPPATAEEALILHVNPPIMPAALVSLDRAELARRRIGYWVWELETIPRAWAAARDFVHEIWTPSRFAADALARTFAQPIRVAPHPAALRAPQIDDELRRAARVRLGLEADDFLALTSFSMSSGFERKNPLAAIRAFKDAFAGNPRAHLIVRCRDAHAFPAGAKALREAAREGPIVLIEVPGPQDELNALYAACDAYLSLHRSEGFGLNLAEAMLCARPVIATAWSGNLDFMDANSAALVPARLIPVTDPQRIYRVRGARWAEPDHDAAVTHLRTLARDPDKRTALGQAAAALAREKLSGGAVAMALAGELRGVKRN